MLRFGVEGGGEDDVEKLGVPLEKSCYATAKARKTKGVLRNVLIICPGSYFKGSADQESLMTE